MYVCAAKRYYKYFTGFEVDLSDIFDSTRNIKLNAQEQKHRDLVILLGKKLKETQNARQLIIDIISLPQYRKVDFGLYKL